MTREGWLSQFEDELKKLRPHFGQRLAGSLALRTIAKDHFRPYSDRHHVQRERPVSARQPTFEINFQRCLDCGGALKTITAIERHRQEDGS